MLKFIKDWTLPISLLTGAIGYQVFTMFAILTPFLIFTMLLLTFSKVSPKDLKIKRSHLWLLSIQILGALIVYGLLYKFNKLVAEGVMVCVICPTATAAAVITSKLGGSAASVTTYTLLANIGAAVAVPLFFPMVELNPNVTFAYSFWLILSKVFPLLICPFLMAWLIQKFLPKLHHVLSHYHDLAFYLWACSLTIVSAQTVSSLINSPADGLTELMIAFGALIACGLQFFLGNKIGGLYNDHIGGSQSLGQKNTILAIWMAHTYLNPLSSVGPGSYVLWQNIVNSWRLWRKRQGDERN
ncbi:transporter [uncultured Bacteroides sp.]|uniref:bile acid:sodium symporter family protein n=1 Tax=uncultured Bacteroides sp. TaxID=162156 RepID=UPI002AAB2357|nr:transporter [uncultured Bacteroides sp.]